MNLCISRKINDEIINGFFSWSDLSQMSTVYQRNGILIEKKKCYSAVVKVAFDKKEVLPKPPYILVNENESHWILVTEIPKAKCFFLMTH